jgi:hypothetical protein
MKRALIICIILIALTGVKGYAQGQFRKPLKSTSHSILGFSNYNVGLKLGCPWSYMKKTELKETSTEGHFGYLAGFFFERNLGHWSVALESTFAQKGAKMHNERPYQIGIGDFGKLKTVYSVAYNVVTVRIPVSYYFKGLIKDDVIVPYVFVGPEIDLPLGFNLDLWPFKMEKPTESVKQQFDGPNGEEPYSETSKRFNVGPNVSAAAGIGLMTKVRFENSAILFKLDAAYNRGLFNLAEPTASAWKWPFEEQDTHIFAHDVEVCLSIVYPIKKILHDACHNLQ